MRLDLRVFGEAVGLLPLVEFSMANSIRDMIRAQAYALGITMILFSVLWPYFKIGVTLCMWYLPAACVTPAGRGSVLSWLDALGKWSMIDIFVMVVTLAAFRHQVRALHPLCAARRHTSLVLPAAPIRIC